MTPCIRPTQAQLADEITSAKVSPRGGKVVASIRDEQAAMKEEYRRMQAKLREMEEKLRAKVGLML